MSPPKPFRRRYGLSPAWIAALNGAAIAAVAASLLLMSLPATRSATYNVLTDETGPVELVTAGAFLLGAILSFRLSREARDRGEGRAVVLAYAGFALLCFLGVLEETSWGQTLFDYRAPEWIRDLNEQGEMNLHNLPGVMELNSAGVLVFGVLGLLGIRLESSDRWRTFCVPRALAPLFAVIACMAALETFIDFHPIERRFDMTVGTVSETVEMIGAIGCLACVWLNGRRLRRRWDAGLTALPVADEAEPFPERAA